MPGYRGEFLLDLPFAGALRQRVEGDGFDITVRNRPIQPKSVSGSEQARE
jgi:hypothetical protein